MAFPEVGLQAVLEGTDQFEKNASSVSGSVTNLGNTVLKTAGVMAGIGVGAVAALGAGFVGLAGSALGPIGDFERMSASLSSLVAREVQAGDSTLSFDQALEKAGPATKDLINWVEQLAIISPFESKDVATAMQMAMSFGLTTDRAKELVSAEINFAAATGKGGEAMQRISMALGKMNTSGKVSGEVLMQLAEAGVPAQKILQEMGYTAEDASKGLVPVDKFMTAVIADFNKFGSAAQAQANTWPGLLSSLEDLKKIALREFFTKTFEAIKPYVVEFVTMLQDPGVRKWLGEVGALVGQFVGGALEKVVGIAKEVKVIFDGLLLVFSDFQSGVLGRDYPWEDVFPPWLADVAYKISDAVFFVIDNLDLFKGALEGIGAVLAGAAIAAAIAGIGAAVLALANPVTALIAAGALLGAAWETNWMGMRDILTEFWEKQAKPALEDLMIWLQDNVPKAIETLAKFWEKDLLPAILTFSEWVKTDGIPAAKKFAQWVMTKLVPAVLDLVKALEAKLIPMLLDLVKSFDKIQRAFSDANKEMSKTGGTFDKLAKFWEKNGDKIMAITGKVFGYIASQIEQKLQIAVDTVGLLADIISGDWEDALERMKRIQENILNTMTLGIYGWVKDIATGMGKGMRDILDVWGSNWESLKKIVQEALSRAYSAISDWLSSTASSISNFASSLRNAAMTMMGGLIEGVASQAAALASRIISTVQGAVSDLLTSVSSGPIGSLLSIVGHTLISMIQAGISAVSTLATALINAVASAVSSLINSIVSGGIGSTLSSVGQTIMNLISAAVATVTSLASSLVSAVASAIANLVNAIASGTLFNTLRAVGGAIVDGLVRGINANASAVADALSDIVNSAIQAIKNELGIPGDPGPSKYMAAVGSALMRGYVQGILSQAGNVADAMQMAISGAQGLGGMTLAPSLVSAPGMGGGGGGTVVNNFHLGQNTISNGMDAAVFEARVLSVIRKNLR